MNKLAEQINDYLRYSQIERGLSPNTIAAYKQDLLEFLAFVKEEQMPAWPLEAVEIGAIIGDDEADILLHHNHRIAARTAVTIRTAAMAMPSR